MQIQPFTISHLRSGGIITNYHCSSSCRHCLYCSSPRWPKEYITPETTWKNLTTIRNLGCRSIHIGGGEPLLNPDCVAATLIAAAEAGVTVEYVETNSSWFHTLDVACATLERVAEAGLETLLVSISPFHNEHIPFLKVKGVCEACRRTGISVFPWISTFIDEIETFDDTTVHSLDEYRHCFGDDYIENLPRRYWIAPGGRALDTFGKFAVARSVSAIAAENRTGCVELAHTGHFHLDLFGNYVPGLCSGLAICRDDLGKPLDAGKYPIITNLFEGGIGAFVSWAIEYYGYSIHRGSYPSKCHLCNDIRRFLVVEKGLRLHELQPVGYYLYR